MRAHVQKKACVLMHMPVWRGQIAALLKDEKQSHARDCHDDDDKAAHIIIWRCVSGAKMHLRWWGRRMG
ncbi:hypothetical protein CFR74_00670 [Novacetimonas hansenii]|nr:hypothetical protein CFR74_00670 [Novacetimonas hansenii]